MTVIVNHANIFPISICLFETARLYGVAVTGSRNMAEIDALDERIDELDAAVRRIERIVSKSQRSADMRKRRWLEPMRNFVDLVLDKALNVLFVFVIATFLLFLFLMLMP